MELRIAESRLIIALEIVEARKKDIQKLEEDIKKQKELDNGH
jgi:hypothetical protein